MMTNNILSWNCRGLSTRDTLSRVFHLICQNKLVFVCLVETRANLDRVDRFCFKLPHSWGWAAILVDGYSGSILVCWRLSLGQVTPIAISHRVLHIIVSPNSSYNFIISVVYNSHRFRSQCFVWYELSKISSLSPLAHSWYFNTVLHRNEHKGGSFSYYSRKAMSFLNFIDFNNLLDLNFSGLVITWCNNQRGLARHWARLDRCLVNLDQISLFKSYSLKHLSRSFSDHSPLILFVSLHFNRSCRTFHFENYWLEYSGCHSAIKDAWSFFPHVNLMQVFLLLLSRAQYSTNSWRSTGLNSIELALNRTKTDIYSLELSNLSLDTQIILQVQ